MSAIGIAYPPAALARGDKGQVLLEVVVGRSGRVESVVVLDPAGQSDFARAAAEGIRRARFRPAEGSQGKASSRLTYRIEFSYE